MQHATDIDDVLKDDGIGHQVVVLDDLLLLFRIVLGNDAFAAKEQPSNKAIVCLYLVGHRGDLLAHLWISQVLEQKDGAYDPPQLAKGLIEPILSRLMPQFA